MSKQNKIDIKSVLNITLRLFLVCTIIAAIVAAVYHVTADKIEENEIKKREESIRIAFPMGISEENNSYKVEDSSCVTGLYNIKDNNNSIIGYAVFCEPKGFGGEISMLVAFDSTKAIKAVRIISNNETPGIGDQIANDKGQNFREQFVGKGTTMSFGVDGIDKISGASKSSNAALNGINDAISVISSLS